jgi:hypothetical protein
MTAVMEDERTEHDAQAQPLVLAAECGCLGWWCGGRRQYGHRDRLACWRRYSH